MSASDGDVRLCLPSGMRTIGHSSISPAFPLKLVDFSEELLRMCGMFRNFALEKVKELTIMATVVLQVPDESLVSKVKNACKMLVGVTSVKVHKATKKKDYDITKTAGYREAMDNVKNGRVYHYDSLKDFYKEMGL